MQLLKRMAAIGLGLAQDVLSRATRLHEITVRSLTNSATLARLPLKDVYASVARADLATVFERKIGQTGRFRQHNTTVEQVSQKEDGVVIIGKDAGLHHVAGLVAADGVAGFGRAFISGQPETALRASLAADSCIAVNNKLIGPQNSSQAVSNLCLATVFILSIIRLAIVQTLSLQCPKQPTAIARPAVPARHTTAISG